MKAPLRLALFASDDARAQEAAATLGGTHDWVPPEQADALVLLGGDGYLLHVMHRMLDLGRVVPVYGLNHGTVGFLMNKAKSSRSIGERVARARPVAVCPLEMIATTQRGTEHSFYAINEVSLLRETRMTAKLEVKVNGKVRMTELAGDGVLVATPAGSTAYNLSANGPILPLGCGMMALTPLSPFRPRRWRGALLPRTAKVVFEIHDMPEPALRTLVAPIPAGTTLAPDQIFTVDWRALSAADGHSTQGFLTFAVGTVNANYRVEYHDYKEAAVTYKIK